MEIRTVYSIGYLSYANCDLIALHRDLGCPSSPTGHSRQIPLPAIMAAFPRASEVNHDGIIFVEARARVVRRQYWRLCDRLHNTIR